MPSCQPPSQRQEAGRDRRHERQHRAPSRSSQQNVESGGGEHGHRDRRDQKDAPELEHAEDRQALDDGQQRRPASCREPTQHHGQGKERPGSPQPATAPMTQHGQSQAQEQHGSRSSRKTLRPVRLSAKLVDVGPPEGVRTEERRQNFDATRLEAQNALGLGRPVLHLTEALTAGQLQREGQDGRGGEQSAGQSRPGAPSQHPPETEVTAPEEQREQSGEQSAGEGDLRMPGQEHGAVHDGAQDGPHDRRPPRQSHRSQRQPRHPGESRGVREQGPCGHRSGQTEGQADERSGPPTGSESAGESRDSQCGHDHLHRQRHQEMKAQGEQASEDRDRRQDARLGVLPGRRATLERVRPEGRTSSAPLPAHFLLPREELKERVVQELVRRRCLAVDSRQHAAEHQIRRSQQAVAPEPRGEHDENQENHARVGGPRGAPNARARRASTQPTARRSDATAIGSSTVIPDGACHPEASRRRAPAGGSCRRAQCVRGPSTLPSRSSSCSWSWTSRRRRICSSSCRPKSRPCRSPWRRISCRHSR